MNAKPVSAGELRQMIEQYETLAEEKQGIADLQKELLGEVKSRGYDAKIFRRVIALRKLPPDQRAEQAAVLDIYMDAIGGAE